MNWITRLKNLWPRRCKHCGRLGMWQARQSYRWWGYCSERCMEQELDDTFPQESRSRAEVLSGNTGGVAYRMSDPDDSRPACWECDSVFQTGDTMYRNKDGILICAKCANPHPAGPPMEGADDDEEACKAGAPGRRPGAKPERRSEL